MSARILKKRGTAPELGLGIVEVIAAMVILSVCLLLLMDIGLGLQRQTYQLEDRTKRAEAVRSALAYFRTIIVGSDPVGENAFGDWSVRWRAELLNEKTSFPKQRYALPPLIIGLYTVDLTVEYQLDGIARQATHTTRAVGWSEEGGA